MEEFTKICEIFSDANRNCVIFTRYKEGRVILERALVQECDGIEEHPVND